MNLFSTQSLSLPRDGYMSSAKDIMGSWSYVMVFAVVLLLWFSSTIYTVFFHPLSSVPGPWLARFSEAWRSHKYFRGTWHQDVVLLHRKYGKVVRIAPNELSIVDEAGLKALYGHGQKVVKSKWYDTWTVPNMSMSFFAVRDIKTHRHLRSRVSSGYSMTAIQFMEPLIQDVANSMWQRMGEFADRNVPVRMDEWANYFAFDVVGSLALGGPIGFIEKGKDVDGIIRSIHDGFWLMANMGNMSLQMTWFNNRIAQWALRSFGGERLQAFSKFVDWLEVRVDERYRDGLGSQRRDMLQLFIDAKDMTGQPVTKGDVMMEGVNILGAGADTTTIGILSALGSLLLHPEAIVRLQAEIDEAYCSLGLEKTGRDIEFLESSKLPFLSAVIKESTRLHPSIQYQLPRMVGPGGLQLDEVVVPEGTVCGISPASMNRSMEIFGPDADEWKPERWIATDANHEEKIKYWNSHLTTFGMGSRSCVGKNLATVEMHNFIAQFFRRFDASLVDLDRPWQTKTQWFAFQRNFWRHFKACKERLRADVEIPQLTQNTRGKKKTACDRCSHRKRACSSQWPCRTCLKDNRPCTYTAQIANDENHSSAAHDTHQDTSPMIDKIHGDVRSGALTERAMAQESPAPIAPLDARASSDGLFYMPATEGGILDTYLDEPLTNELGLDDPFHYHAEEPSDLLIPDLTPSVSLSTESQYSLNNRPDDQLSRFQVEESLNVTSKIVAMLKDITISKPRGSKINISWSGSIEFSCHNFFSPQRLQDNLELFWSCWYPNCPIIHKPSFSTFNASPLLIAAMAVLGACLSPSPSVRANANIWFNSVEELAFLDEALLDESITVDDSVSCDDDAVYRRLEAIQAAYLVCLIQYWEGVKPSKRRIRRNRYAVVLDAARDFGLDDLTRHKLPVEDSSTFSWKRFILLEMLIRTGTYIFLLDGAFVIFHNSPPRLVVAEMRMSLVCPDSCFQASSQEECFVILHNWTSSEPRQAQMRVVDLVEAMCNNHLSDEETCQGLAGLSMLNLFTAITALHTLGFHYEVSLAPNSGSWHLQMGLNRWISLYEQADSWVVENSPGLPLCDEMWRRLGFIRHAKEFWMLAQLMLDKSQVELNTAGPSGGPFDKTRGTVYDENTMDYVHNLVQSLGDLKIA
ncbi:cytochrome p450 [Colletotrichum scovillei]|uniref:Cytochrome p450 n=1 Tax=Colletotrichum scovillei TaxID=1209932 RepID=A0A9P7RAX4_9PEZI|nr:cytochrome p450 [Colletotrichum scovillei]KAG7070960.1 cytochrome p450 [Colletotrichum scovillei]KAG7079208.1 cytochrome p450 [Colletotrichum scovillei]